MNILNMWLFTSILNSSCWSSSSKPMRISADNSLKLAIQKLFKWLFCQKGATHLSAMGGKQKSFRAGQRQDMTKGTAGSKAGGLICPRVAAKPKRKVPPPSKKWEVQLWACLPHVQQPGVHRCHHPNVMSPQQANRFIANPRPQWRWKGCKGIAMRKLPDMNMHTRKLSLGFLTEELYFQAVDSVSADHSDPSLGLREVWQTLQATSHLAWT